jgi:hypothetical protein
MITPEKKAIILKAFYRFKLREGEDIIDNTNETLALETGYSKLDVHRTLNKEMKRLKEIVKSR